MATKTKRTTKKLTTTKTNRPSTRSHKTAAKKVEKNPVVSFGWRIFWVLVCVVVSSCLIIALDDAIFGINDRVLANYTNGQTEVLTEEVSTTSSIPWEELVTNQLSQDIFIPIAWGTLITIVEVYILYKARLIHRNATSAILIAALWLLPIALAVIRIVSCYAFTFSTTA